MEVVITKMFSKQFKYCPKYIQEAALAVLDSLENAESLNDIPDAKKLAGYKFYYRIRIGDYRVGMKQQKPKIIVMCILHRGSIYKVFPPQ